MDTLPIDKEQSTLFVEETEEINNGDAEKVHNIHLEKSLNPTEKEEFIQFFKKRAINFAWYYEDMPGLDPKLVLYHFPLLPGVKPFKQKLRKMHPHIALLVKNELQKLLKEGFIRSIDYAECISNLLPVTKHTGGIRICTEFRDLNKAFPKDDFPLPNIDMIVDLTTGNEMLSLMDFLVIIKSELHKRTNLRQHSLFCGEHITGM